MGNPLNKLYVRIWLAIVLAVAVLTLLVGWIWRLAAEPPLRDVVVRNDAGQIIGRGRRPPMPGEAEERQEWSADAASRPRGAASQPYPGRQGRRFGPGHEADREPGVMRDPDHPGGTDFMVRMHDGQTMRMRFVRPPPSPWSRPPFGFVWMLAWVSIAVALATYPIVRTLTRRLERLQDGVKQWGEATYRHACQSLATTKLHSWHAALTMRHNALKPW